MTVICHIHYTINPHKLEKFAEYAERWHSIIPRLGGNLLGYFLPHEGTNNIAHAMIGFDGLAAYEDYRQRLKADSEAFENFAFAQAEKFILAEARTFLKPV